MGPIADLHVVMQRVATARPISEWHEDYGHDANVEDP